jgi:Protein of unknown function (DUF998)
VVSTSPAQIGLRRAGVADSRVGTFLVSAALAGLLGAGAFRTDPVSGYPPGTPDVLPGYTALGALHDAFSAPTFLGLPVAALAYAGGFWRRGNRGWAVYSAVSGLGMLAAFALASIGFSQRHGLVEYAGALQRISVMIGFTWLSALTAKTLGTNGAAGRAPADQ